MLPEAASAFVVADSMPLWRAGVVAVLTREGYAPRGEATVAAELPDLLIQGESEWGHGFVLVGSVADWAPEEVVTRIRALAPDARIMLLLARGARQALADLLNLDVNGLMARTIGAAELADAMRRADVGERVVDPALVSGDGAEEDLEASVLTAREREVLTLLSSGQSNREIASALFVSLPTVKTHLAHIYAKLGAKNRNDALGRAVALGLLH